MTVLINGTAGFTGATGSTAYYTLTITDQSSNNIKQQVIDYGTITTANASIVSFASYNVKVIGVGATTVTVHHPDSGVVNVTVPVVGYYGTTALVVTPAAFTGTTTGQTQQLTVVNQNGYNLTAQCTYVSSNINVATVNSTGLVTFVGNTGDVYITATHIYTGVYARPTTIWRGGM